MDVIEFLMIGPFIFYVVDFEANVRWYPDNTASSVPPDHLTFSMYVANSNGIGNIT